MKLVIEIDVESEEEAKLFCRESKKAVGIYSEIGRPINNNVRGFGDVAPTPARVYAIQARQFKARIER